jgi:hypothetical protein
MSAIADLSDAGREKRLAKRAPARKPDCHPDRKHHSRGMCVQCAQAQYYVKRHEPVKYGPQEEGVVRVPVAGWGYLSACR